jgi:hypothetical protein
MPAINYEIIELSRIDQIMYSDGSGNFHFLVSYLVAFGAGDEMVLEMLPTATEQLLQMPEIGPDTPVNIRSELGGDILGRSTVGKIDGMIKSN